MAMTKKKIILEDGRYLIYYTFDEKPAKQADMPVAKCCECKCRGGTQ